MPGLSGVKSVRRPKTPATRSELVGLLALSLLQGSSDAHLEDAVMLARRCANNGEAARRLMECLAVGRGDRSLTDRVLSELEMADLIGAACAELAASGEGLQVAG